MRFVTIQKRIGWIMMLFPIFFLFLSYGAYAVTPVNGSVIRGGDNPPPTNKIWKRRIEVFNFIKGNVLYTEHNKYSLADVSVTYSQTKLQEDSPTDEGRNMVGLIFMDEILREVIIYP